MERRVVAEIRRMLSSPVNLIQILTGPRQVGKTTAARAVGERWNGPVRFAAADLPIPPGPEWIETQWNLARRDAASSRALLVLDEVQKVRGWSEVVKACWDEDRAARRRLRVLILGSSALLLSKGTTESLAGRFFLHRCPHWSYTECRKAFAWELDDWIYHGGYPGAAVLVDDPESWKRYISDSLIETVLARDVLALQTVSKPALLRNLFLLATQFPAQILSYNKMLGQLQDAGNTTTLAHYLKLLEGAFLISGLEKYSPGGARGRGSSPKLVLWNNALITAIDPRSFREARSSPEYWGRLVENAVGAHLLNHLQGLSYEIGYWRHRNHEIDYIVRTGRKLWALEVKSGRHGAAAGIPAFREKAPKTVSLIVGSGGMSLSEFFSTDPGELFT